jgi:hypothetical protein
MSAAAVVPRDPQRRRAYRSEASAAERSGSRAIQSFDEAQNFVGSVTASRWWAIHVPRRCGVLLMESKRRRRRASAYAFLIERLPAGDRVWRQPNILLPALSRCGSWSDWTLLHELAHIARLTVDGDVREEPAHGPAWAGLYLALVHEFKGEEAAAALKDEFARHRVRDVVD